MGKYGNHVSDIDIFGEQDEVLHVDYGGTDNVPDAYISCIRVNRVLG